MDLTVVLATYNRASSLRTTLQSFADLNVPASLSWELLIVDNNSSDTTRLVVEHFATTVGFPVRYLFEGKQGRSAALNSGILNSEGAIIAFTDDDVILHRDWLVNVVQTFKQFNCAGFAGRVLPQWTHSKPEWFEMDGQFAVVNFDFGDETREIRSPPLGANSAFRRDLFKRYGLFRLDLGVSGSRHTITCDDTEFGERLIQAGEKIVYCPHAVIYHPVDPQRTTKEYFLSWYYYNGVSLTRMSGVPKEGVFWFGAPRWLYREMLTHFGKWVFTAKAKQRFHHKLHTYRSVGRIVESRRLSLDELRS